MTNAKKATALVSVIALGALIGATPLFAAGKTITMSSSVSSTNADYLAITVAAPEAAKAFFVAHGANANTISAASADMPAADRNKIRQIYSNYDDPDYRSAVNSIVYAALQKELVAGKVESVTTSIGPCSWTVTYNGPGYYVDGDVFSAD